MVERNMCNAVMRGIVVPPGSRAISRANRSAVLAPAEIAAPIRQIEEKQKNLTAMLAEVAAVDLSSRSVTVSYPASGAHKITFDFLIIAAGMQSSYFGHDEFARYAPGLKNLSDAERIRTKILDAYELAELTDDESERSRLMTFVLVGGGATGVELAASMAQMAAVTLRGNFRRTDPANTSIVLIEGGSRILPCARIGSARYTDRARWRLDARPGLCREPLPLP
jgi:NADH dehydrogenase